MDQVSAPVEPRVFEPATVYGSPEHSLERDARALYGYYQWLRDTDVSSTSKTSRLLRERDVAAVARRALARAHEELDELRGVLAGTHRHHGDTRDVILEAGQVNYWLIVALVARGVTYDQWQPHRLWEQGWSNGTLNGDINPVAKTESALLVAAAWLCREAGVHPSDVLAADLATMRVRHPQP